MCKRLKRMLSLLLLSFLLLSPVTGWAATVSATEQEMRALLQNSQRRQEISELLLKNSTEVQRLLLKSTEEVRLLKQDLAESKALIKKLSEELQAATLLSKNQEDLIAKTNGLFEKYSAEMKAKNSHLKTERNVLMILAGAAVVWGATR